MLECNGKIELMSNEHDHTVTIDSYEIKKERRWKQDIKFLNPDNNQREFLKLEVAEMTGGCCWKIRDSYKKGKDVHLSVQRRYEPGWPIKSVQLLEECVFPDLTAPRPPLNNSIKQQQPCPLITFVLSLLASYALRYKQI